MNKKTIAVSGDAGSFSEEAGLLYAQRENVEPEIVFAIDMEGVLREVDAGNAELGVFPVVNSRGGLVQPAFHAMGKYTFDYIDELWFEVQQCLMVLPGLKREDITQVTSQLQAISQCERYLRREFSDTPLVEWQDTAKSAKDLSEGTLSKTSAVIGSQRAAHIYGLDVMEKGIHDNHPNLTTFIVVKKK